MMLTSAAASATDAGPWTVENLTRAERIGSHTLSDDGKMAAWVRTEIVDDDGKATRKGDLWLARLAEGDGDGDGAEVKPVRLTHTQSSYGSLAFSPDGKHLAFTSNRPAPNGNGDDKKVKGSQIWVLPLAGGEARRVTSFPTAVSAFEWIDDETFLARRSEEPTQRQSGAEASGEAATAIDDPRHSPYRRLFRVGLDGSSKALGRDDDWVGEFAASPDGSRAVISAQQSLSYGFDAKVPPKTFLVDLESGERTEILDDGRYLPGSFAWAPDGESFFFQDPFSNHPKYRQATVNHLYRYDLDAGTAQRVDLDWLRGITGRYAVVMPTGENAGPVRLLALLENGVRFRPVTIEVPAAGGERVSATVSDLGGERKGQFDSFVASRDGSRLLYLGSHSNMPPQLFTSAVNGSATTDEQQLGTINEGQTQKTVGRTEVMRWTGAEGDEVEGLLHYPLGWSEGDAPAPLVLDIHGGPTGVDRDRWDSSWGAPNILWRQRGAFVFQVNYHGSGGYGVEWAESIEQRYYELEVPDIESGVDVLIERGLVDAKQLATTGWSNGGILSAGLIIQTERYRAAVVGAADVEWISDWGNVAFGASFDNYYFGGPPWERLDHYIEKSPYFKLKDVTTPTLIHTGDADVNVPPSQSWSMFRAMQQLEKTDVRFVLYPGEPHGLRSVAHQERKLREDLAWLDRHLFETRSDDDYLDDDPVLPRDSKLAALLELRQVARRDDGALGVEEGGTLVPEVTAFADHTVGRFEVTRAQWAQFETATGDELAPGEHDLPALVSFEDAQRYVSWLSERTGRSYRLPTAKEAKKLQRGGGTTLEHWLGYDPNPDELAAAHERLSSELGDDWSALLVPGDQEAGHRGRRGQQFVWGLGGNVAEWASADPEKEGAEPEATGPSADRPAKSKEPARLIGVRIILNDNAGNE